MHRVGSAKQVFRSYWHLKVNLKPNSQEKAQNFEKRVLELWYYLHLYTRELRLLLSKKHQHRCTLMHHRRLLVHSMCEGENKSKQIPKHERKIVIIHNFQGYLGGGGGE